MLTQPSKEAMEKVDGMRKNLGLKDCSCWPDDKELCNNCYKAHLIALALDQAKENALKDHNCKYDEAEILIAQAKAEGAERAEKEKDELRQAIADRFPKPPGYIGLAYDHSLEAFDAKRKEQDASRQALVEERGRDK